MKLYYLVHIEDLYIQVDIPDTSPFLSYSADIYQMDSIQVHCNNRPWGNLHILCIFIEISKQLINVFQAFFCTILFRLKYANLFLKHDSIFSNQSAKLNFLLSDVLNRWEFIQVHSDAESLIDNFGSHKLERQYLIGPEILISQ